MIRGESLRLRIDQRAGNANTTGQGQLSGSTIATDNSTHNDLNKTFFVKKCCLRSYDLVEWKKILVNFKL